MPRFELHQDIHITVRPKIIPQNRPEQCKPSDMMTPAEFGNLCFVDLNFSAHLNLSIQQAQGEGYRTGTV